MLLEQENHFIKEFYVMALNVYVYVYGTNPLKWINLHLSFILPITTSIMYFRKSRFIMLIVSSIVSSIFNAVDCWLMNIYFKILSISNALIQFFHLHSSFMSQKMANSRLDGFGFLHMNRNAFDQMWI